ncbi:MAG: domain S-box protein [Frankiales bacterium]|nr:domain S-box protein [Frankiales bacterium]
MTSTSEPSAAARLPRLLLGTALLSALTQVVARLVVADDGPVVHVTAALPWAHGWLLLGVLLVLTVLGDQLSVPLRHGEQTEHLTFFEAAILLDVALLPADAALDLGLLAMVFREVVRRRPPQKAVFNVSMLATAAGALVLVVHLLTGPGAGLGWRTVVALVAGTLAFAAVNLLHISRLLAVVADVAPWQLVREEARLSTVMALGNVALGGTVLAVSTAAPAMLPFTVMPAAALLFAYRAAAQEAEERERTTRLLELSQLLAGRREADDLLAAFLELARQVFGADLALAVLDVGAQPGGTHPLSVLDDREQGSDRRVATGAERRLLERAALDGAGALTDDLPEGWARALVAPLEAEGRRLGAVVLATRDRSRALGTRELTLLTPTASALAVALRGAAHLRRVEEETGKLQAVVDQSSDGILVLDGAGVVQLWSPAVERLSGRSSAAALGRPLPALLATRGADGTPCDPFLVGRSLLLPAEPQTTVEVTLLRDDGEERVVRCAFAGVFDDDGVLQRVVVIVHDVTRERQVERLKADFIATVSHELRTPVTPIKGYADLLRRRGDRMTPEKRNECLDVIVDRAGHLARLVEDLLLASRISATESASPAQVDMGRDDLAALTRRACADFGADGERVTAVLPDGPVQVACDPVRVIQVLTNLVGNALKYSTPGTPVQVRLVVDGGGGLAQVEVSDSGRGIPADQVERVFEKFHRVEDPMRMTTGGTGLGLYIARQLATAMGGALSCRSTLNVGSTFVFTLPLAGEELAAGAGPSRGLSVGRGASGRPDAGAPVSAASDGDAVVSAPVPVPVPGRDRGAGVGLPVDAVAVAAGTPGQGGTVAGGTPGQGGTVVGDGRAGQGTSPVALRRGRNAPPWAVPPPRPAEPGGPEAPQPLG